MSEDVQVKPGEGNSSRAALDHLRRRASCRIPARFPDVAEGPDSEPESRGNGTSINPVPCWLGVILLPRTACRICMWHIVGS